MCSLCNLRVIKCFHCNNWEEIPADEKRGNTHSFALLTPLENNGAIYVCAQCRRHIVSRIVSTFESCEEAICVYDFAGNTEQGGCWVVWCAKTKIAFFGGAWDYITPQIIREKPSHEYIKWLVDTWNRLAGKGEQE